MVVIGQVSTNLDQCAVMLCLPANVVLDIMFFIVFFPKIANKMVL